MKCKKIRLKPTAEQARVLRKWTQDARTTYNQALRLVKDGKAKPNLTLKKLVVTARREDSPKVRAVKLTPADVRVRAVHDLIDAFKSAAAASKARVRKKKQGGRQRRFEIQYKSRRLTSDSFGFESKSVHVQGHHLYLFARQKRFGMSEGIKMSEVPGIDIMQCCRVQYVFGRWYFLAPYRDTPPSEGCGQRVGAYDPGIRTMITYFTEDECGEIGFDTYTKIDAITLKAASIKQRLCEVKSQKVGNYRQKAKKLRSAWHRANARALNLASDLHWKTIKFLLDRFDVLVAPRLNVRAFVDKDSKLGATTKQRLLFLRHGAFRTRLLYKAQVRGKVVLDLKEHGTTRTCSNCGRANHKVGSLKTFACPECKLFVDRDVNSAKNHALKAFFGNDI